ncbi:MAG TPA: hypothetical protein VNH46_08255 [Gemmatimonadales bacterium]|nr:hypothetical protein [Gemmatimonadales bacterium]
MSNRLIRVGAGALGALALTLAACSSTSTGPSGNTNLLSANEIQDVGQDVAEDVSELNDATTFNAATGVFVSAAATGATVNTVPPACVTISPNPPTNSDGDAVPDSVRFDFNACVFTRLNGNIVDSLGGTIDIIDPLPNQISMGVRHVFTNFFRKRTNVPFPLRSFSETLNGTREWGGNADTIGHTITNFTTQWTHASGRTSTHTRDWTAKFTATTPGTISLILPLPEGDLTVNGTGSWATAGRTWSVQTTTVQPLHYDPTCLVTPRFTSGTVDLVVTRNGVTTDVEIVFSACGQYSVTKTSASA